MTRPSPLSPHLQIYRLPLTALLSISHRITGVLLSAGVFIWLSLLMSLVAGSEIYEYGRGLLLSLPGRLFTWGFIFALCFHLCHGIRHLFWDIGYGLDRKQLDQLAALELFAAVALTLILMTYVSL